MLWLSTDNSLAQSFNDFSAKVERRNCSQIHQGLRFARTFRKNVSITFLTTQKSNLTACSSLDPGPSNWVRSAEFERPSENWLRSAEIRRASRSWVHSAEIHPRSRRVHYAELRRASRSWARSADFDRAIRELLRQIRSHGCRHGVPGRSRYRHQIVCVAIDERDSSARTLPNRSSLLR
jgi:hypothetical protein